MTAPPYTDRRNHLSCQPMTWLQCNHCFDVLKIKGSVGSLGLTSNPQLLSGLGRQGLDLVTSHKWSLTQPLPALHAPPSEKHLWTLFDKLIAKWAISWRAFRIASRKPEWQQKKNAYTCKAVTREGERILESGLMGGGGGQCGKAGGEVAINHVPHQNPPSRKEAVY